jgi:sugar lactone lactonase YvrE
MRPGLLALIVVALGAAAPTPLRSAPAFNRPWAFAENSHAASDGRYWVLSQPKYHTVLLWDAAQSPARLLQVVGGHGRIPGRFVRPTGVAIDAERRLLFVSDTDNHRVQVFRFDVDDVGGVRGVTFLKAVGRRGNGAEELDGPEGLARDGDGNLYVCDSGNARIQVLNRELRFVRSWGGPGTGNGQFLLPLSVAVLSQPARVYVVDAGALRVTASTPEGTFLFAWGGPPAGRLPLAPGAFAYPFALAIPRDGTALYVADSRRHVVMRFAPDGTFQGEWGGQGPEDGHFYQPESVALDSNGRVLVTDYGSTRAQVFTAAGRFLATLSVPAGDLVAPPTPR